MKKKVAFLFIVLGAIAAGIVLMLAQPGFKRQAPAHAGDRAPDFRLQALDGRSVSLSELRGQVVMVHFWATWCPPCVEEIPSLDRLARSLKGQGFEVLAVSVDEGGAPAVKTFLERNHLTLPVLLDSDHSVAGSYGTFRFPETYIVDRNGMVRNKIVGAASWDSPDAVQMIRDLIAQK